MAWTVEFGRQAEKDAAMIAAHGKTLARKVDKLLTILEINPFQNPPPYEKLGGELTGSYSRRINKQHRLVYEVEKNRKVVFVARMWTHYE